MANNFYECTKSGGKVVNKKTEDGKTITMCYDKEGKTHVKKKFIKKEKKSMDFSTPTQESLQQLIIYFNNNKTK